MLPSPDAVSPDPRADPADNPTETLWIPLGTHGGWTVDELGMTTRVLGRTETGVPVLPQIRRLFPSSSPHPLNSQGPGPDWLEVAFPHAPQPLCTNDLIQISLRDLQSQGPGFPREVGLRTRGGPVDGEPHHQRICG
ncbi:MAG: hypothetical protein AAFU79_29590 [Myxococcota bacterium]